jgi:hypothetical protein
MIVWNQQTGQYKTQGRVGFGADAKTRVDTSTRDLVRKGLPVSGAEIAFANRNLVHQQGLPQTDHTGRAHQVSDQNIQLMICDYLNGVIDYWTFLDRVSSLFLTSWIDVVVTSRVARIWYEWTTALWQAHAHIAMGGLRGLTQAQIAVYATRLAETLSSSLANLRVGHQDTDGELNQAIAPRLQRGMMDVLGRFVAYITQNGLGGDVLSVETSILRHTWRAHFLNHVPPVANGAIVVDDVMLGFGPGGHGGPPFILISENMPPAGGATHWNGGGRPVSTIVRPIYYPGTDSQTGRVCYRITRPAMQILAMVMVAMALYQMGVTVFRGLV